MTLPEVMITIAISLIALTGVTAMCLTLLQGSSLSRGLTEASTLAQSRVEELVPLAGVTLLWPANGTTTESGLDALGQAGGSYTRTTTWAQTADGQRRLITVVASWVDAVGTAHSVTARRERSP